MHKTLFIALTLGAIFSAAKPAHNKPPCSKTKSETHSSTSTSPPSSSTNSLATDSFWKPSVGQSWQIVLSGVVNTKVDLVPNVDIFDIDGQSHSQQDIAALHSKGKKVICYFSAGTVEEGRPDVGSIEQYTGKVLPAWPKEKWVDVRVQAVRDVMANRIADFATKGCDALDPDNVDAYNNDNGLNNFQKDDSIDYIKWLSTEAAKHNIHIGLKNAGEIIPSVIDSVAFSVNEECNQINECQVWEAFPNAGKPVFNVEYIDGGDNGSSRRDVGPVRRVDWKRDGGPVGQCPGTNGFSSVVKKLSLDGWVRFCDETEETTALVN
ncbi:glycoside hydrolase superfamily [Crepidotus variabilis]|uniref:alpha-galactosidase n=1 Tax=Crepidotus variabilis TaxID=179855 RepID=A0A9P6EE84_9AGAR|nr:glycoside hydrolase superfamily [Crepidotus variabilis]